MTDFTQPSPSGNPPAPAQVNQSTAAVLDQSTAAVLDGNPAYAAFGHGTMVMGVIHLVAPNAHLLPLKAFRADGSANLSDILSAVYYVRVVGGSAVDWSRTFQFGEDGTITSAKEQADNQVSDIALGAISAAAPD